MEIFGPVNIINNGLTSFVPPCFCFELRDEHGSIVDVVSEIKFSENLLNEPNSDSNLRKADTGLLKLFGYLEGYSTRNNRDEDGKMFVVVKIG